MGFFGNLFGKPEPEEELEIVAAGIIPPGPEGDEAAEALWNWVNAQRQAAGLPTITYEEAIHGRIEE